MGKMLWLEAESGTAIGGSRYAWSNRVIGVENHRCQGVLMTDSRFRGGKKRGSEAAEQSRLSGEALRELRITESLVDLIFLYLIAKGVVGHSQELGRLGLVVVRHGHSLFD